MGYLEQSIASIVIEALVELGKSKPKHPKMTIMESAVYYVGLYLKSSNPKSTDFQRKVYKQKFQDFKSESDLIETLSKEMKNFIKPELRSIQLKKKMIQFDELLKEKKV